MTDIELMNWCRCESEAKPYLRFTGDLLDQMTQSQAEMLASAFGANTFMMLSDREIEFFDWLKVADHTVWEDLWVDTDAEPYIVSISFLPILLRDDGRGFPICDLRDNDNYYFMEEGMVGEESRIILDTARKLLAKKEKLTAAQLLALEISIAPIDIWHFANKHSIRLETAKKAVTELVEDNALIHLVDPAHVAPLVRF